MKSLFFATTYFVCSFVFSQNIYFPVYHYESENGLIHLNVLSIQQNQHNILYFITQGGVYEYTGNSFVKKTEYAGLKSIRNIFFNDTSTFLIHRDKGLFYFSKNKILPFFEKNPFKRPSDKIILTDQYVYNYTDQISLEIYDYKNKIYYGDSLIIKDNLNQAFCVQKINNKLIVGRRKGLYVVEKNQIRLLPQFSKTPVFSIFQDTLAHQLYFGSSNKIIITDDTTMNIQKIIPIDISLPNQSQQFLFQLAKNISKIVVDKYRRIWFCIQPDDNLYLLENNRVYNALDVLKILPTLINDIHLDNFNNIWIATFNDGVYQIASTYWNSFIIKENQKILNITEMEKYRHHLVFATNNGLYIADTAKVSDIKPVIEPDNFFNNEITSLSFLGNNLHCAHPTAFDKKEYRYTSFSVTALPFKYIAPVTNNTFYVSDITNNVILYNASKNKIADTVFKPADYRIQIKHLFYSQQKLFISTNKGMFIFDEKNKNTTALLQDNNVRKTTSIENKILVLYENKIWDYTSNKILLDAEKYNIITITDIKEWNDYYFISSEEGLLLLDKNFSLINILNRKNGLISNVINAIIIHNNQVFLATDKGISYTRISNLLHYSLNIHPPVISHIITNTDTIFPSNTPTLTFPKNTQDIYFHLICPNFNPLTKTSFQYSFNNSDWINFDNSPLHFSSLTGGNYTLYIRATTDNIHYTQPAILTFRKELSINEKEWFWELVIAASIAVIFISAYVIRKIEKKKSAEKLKNIQQMNLLKHQAMNAILSPHFIFNSLTGIQNYILKNDSEKASDYLSKFSRLIRMIIEKASQPSIALQDEIKRLQFYLELEKERFQDKFDFEITIDDKIDLENTFIPNMIIQPYLENAILHGILPKKEKGLVRLSFNKKDTYLEIQIEDDGIGILKGEERKSKHHKSLATQTIAEILSINTQLYRKQQSVQIIDKSNLNPPQNGTIVKILIEL
ncbi:MAG: hypothetical protein Fur0023_10660 [Bacteroidia bacterium]